MEGLVRLAPQAVEWREIDGEVVAIDLNASTYLGVNRTGTLLWPEIAKGTTREALVARLCDAFGVDRQRARADVDAFLEELRRRKLLVAAQD